MLKIGEKLFELRTPKVMGIVNCTPDSFYEGSRKTSLTSVLQEVEKQIKAGVDFIDVGGYSSRPNAKNISESEELNRVIPIIREIKRQFPDSILSIDTFRANVAHEAVENGASIINDIGAFNLDEKMLHVLEKYPIPYIMMHMKGSPQDMMEHTNYKNIFTEMLFFFSEKIKILKQIGVHDIILDPGFGFSKTMEQNNFLLTILEQFQVLNHPLLVGVSRKSMIYKKLGITPEEALNGTSVLHTLAVQKGAKILRVHDVKEAVEVVRLMDYLMVR